MFLSEVAPSAMSNLIKDFGTIASAIFTQVSEVADTIVSTPLLLFTTGFLFLGGCVGIFGRLLSRICLLGGKLPCFWWELPANFWRFLWFTFSTLCFSLLLLVHFWSCSLVLVRLSAPFLAFYIV